MLQTAAAPSIMPSSQRPIPLVQRADLIKERMTFRNILYVVIKDPIALKYHRLRPEQAYVLERLDGEVSLEELRDEMARLYPGTYWTVRGLQTLVGDLHQKRLVVSNRAGQEHGLARQRRKNKLQKLKQTAQNFLFLRLPGWDPVRALDVLYPWTAWLFHPITVFTTLFSLAASALFVLIHFDEFSSALPAFNQFFGWPNLMWLWLTIAITKIIHEFGHGLTCRHFGSECHEMGVMLLVFSPTLYCDVSDSWMDKNKWHRIYIGAAGMYVEAIVSVFALFVWWNTQDGLLHHLALNVYFITTVSSVIFNLNPLMRLDGYYMLSDFLEIPNMRQKADKLVGETFGKYCLGIEPQPDPFAPDSGKFWFVTYAIASQLYKYFIIIAISIFLYTVLKPYRLQSLGAAVAFMSIAGLLIRPFWSVIKMVRQPREKPLSKWKMGATLVVLAAIVSMVLRIPVPTILQAAFYLEPRDVRHVYTRVPGELVSVLKKPGELVTEGEPIAVLSNHEFDLRRQKLVSELEVAREQLRLHLELNDSTRESLARESIESLREQLAELDDQISRLTILAPATGRLVAPSRQEAPPLEAREEQLGRWWGIPLDERNIGALIDMRTEIASIAPTDEMEAVLLVDQADRLDISVGDEVGIKFDHLPDRRFVGTVAEFSHRQLETAPERLSNKAGGGVATVTDPSGRERLQSAAYQAKVPLEDSDGLLMPGLRGKARCLIRERPLGTIIWRYIRKTFLFRL